MNAVGYVVTTGRSPGPRELSLAAWFARRLCAPLVRRENLSLRALEERYGVQGILVVTGRRASFYAGGVEVFFHPSMAKLRIAEIKAGKTDQMVKAMDLHPGEEVLDCTLGLGVDGIVASFVAGPAGRVVGVESSPVLAALVEHGLRNYGHRLPQELLEAMRRIEVVCADHLSYLKELPAESFDVVYFDPMFRAPLYRSQAIAPLRMLANDAPLDRRAVEEALRVARRRVVMKERRGSREFERLGFTCVQGGRSSPVAYGVITK